MIIIISVDPYWLGFFYRFDDLDSYTGLNWVFWILLEDGVGFEIGISFLFFFMIHLVRVFSISEHCHVINSTLFYHTLLYFSWNLAIWWRKSDGHKIIFRIVRLVWGTTGGHGERVVGCYNDEHWIDARFISGPGDVWKGISCFLPFHSVKLQQKRG